jgi:hypothetical protein
MKTAAATAIAAGSLLVAVAFGAPGAGGAGTHYTVHCAETSGTTLVARAFDAGQIERPGGKAHAIEIFKQAHPGGHCWITGPHRDRPGTSDSRG